jgi:hypothetical protein
MPPRCRCGLIRLDDTHRLLFEQLGRITGSTRRLPTTTIASVSHLRSERGASDLWRWICSVCSAQSRRWWHTHDEAIDAARDHSHEEHPEFHDASVLGDRA